MDCKGPTSGNYSRICRDVRSEHLLLQGSLGCGLKCIPPERYLLYKVIGVEIHDTSHNKTNAKQLYCAYVGLGVASIHRLVRRT